MHSDLIYKLSLVTSSGLNLAEVPESEDSAKAQLSGGITSAILTFSREIHERDIEHMSYHDRSVVFVQVSDLIIVVEISSTLDRNLLDKFVHFFKDKVKVHLQNVNVDTLTPAQAKKILSDMDIA